MHLAKVECLDLSNIVSTKVAEWGCRIVMICHGGSNHLQLGERLKRLKKTHFSSWTILASMTCRLHKVKKPLQGSFFTHAYTNQGVKYWLFYSKYHTDVVKLECFKFK